MEGVWELSVSGVRREVSWAATEAKPWETTRRLCRSRNPSNDSTPRYRPTERSSASSGAHSADPADGRLTAPCWRLLHERWSSSSARLVCSRISVKRCSRWGSPAAHFAALKVALTRDPSGRKKVNDSGPADSPQSPQRLARFQIRSTVSFSRSSSPDPSGLNR